MPSEPPRSRPPTHAMVHRVPAAGPLELDSTCILCGQREVLIRHGDQCYRLRHTRSGKLILTK